MALTITRRQGQSFRAGSIEVHLIGVVNHQEFVVQCSGRNYTIGPSKWVHVHPLVSMKAAPFNSPSSHCQVRMSIEAPGLVITRSNDNETKETQ